MARERIRYLSICSGIESATVAWEPLGWTPIAFAEIDPFPCAVLHHHYGSGRPLRMPDPDGLNIDESDRRLRRAAIKGVSYLPEAPHPDGVPNLGDFTQITRDDLGSDIDLLVGGTPCQDFSTAGLRAGLDGDRGNLSLEFLRLAQRTRPRWLVWENVPGVLSSNGGRDFGAILGGMVELGYGFAYRVLDAQYIRVDGYARAVPQRRRRVFVVGHLGDWRRAAAVLFERACLSGHPPPRREARQGVAGTVGCGPNGGRISGTVSSKWAKGSGGPAGDECCNMVVHTLRADGFDASEDGTGRGTPIVPVPFDTTQITNSENRCNPQLGDPCHPLAAGGHPPAVAFDLRGREGGAQFEGPYDTANIRAASGGSSRSYVSDAWAVRRLMPVECERLQGFPDGYTDVPYRRRNATPDGPRYEALGNSKAVNCVRWIGMRISEVESI